MPNYRYERALDGAREGLVRTLSPDEAAPLIASGALVETAEPVTDETAAETTPIEPITHASMVGTKASVATPRASVPPRAAR